MSIVVPVWRDRDALAESLAAIPPHGEHETIIAVAREEALRYRDLEDRFDSVRWVTATRGRGGQMDAGAAVSKGSWLLFLHVDCRLPADWLEVIRQADRVRDVVGGAFRFALDSSDWRARLLEMAVRLRVACLRLPYGDQALFVRRSVFEAIGGFRKLPLMEDVDLVSRLKRQGRLHFSRSAVTTSARRWEEEGWITRSSRNVLLLAKYMSGADPAALVRQYEGRKRAAIVVMARAPWTGGKKRLLVSDDASHSDLRHALFEDTFEAVRSVSDADHLIACEPPDQTDALREFIGSFCEVLSQRGASLGERLANAFDDAFRRRYRAVVVVGSDIPDLPSHTLRTALESLEVTSDQLVIGPARDGGYYLIGLNRPHRRLFQGIDWGTANVLSQTLSRATELALPIRTVDEWSDVDDLGDLDRFRQPGVAASRTREWVRAHMVQTSIQPVRTHQRG